MPLLSPTAEFTSVVDRASDSRQNPILVLASLPSIRPRHHTIAHSTRRVFRVLYFKTIAEKLANQKKKVSNCRNIFNQQAKFSKLT